jgi:hypothetical protein
MRDMLGWSVGWISATEDSVVVATGLANPGYFARRAATSSRPRFAAAAVLVGLYAGSAALALGLLVGIEDGATAAALRVPLVAANLATCSLLLAGARR